uniref:Sigma-54 factor interaction domain-containing protein n=1 Tax=Pseudomonas putida TaxID=303 RepID=Q9FD37_PSEPU|nr:unknown [Pseudomonas putida]
MGQSARSNSAGVPAVRSLQQTINVQMPPLRERDDLPFLIQSLLARLSRRQGIAPRVLGDQELSRMLAYRWPGNTRQLENVLLRFLIDGEVDLEEDLHLKRQAPSFAPNEPLNLETYLDQQRDAHITLALDQANDDKEHAARLLGISRATLYRELRRMKG